MPLDKSCSVDAMSSNIGKMVKDEKKPQAQSVAIAFSVLKKACGVDGDKKMTPKEIVAAGSKQEGMTRVTFGEAKSKYFLADIDGIEGTVEEPGKEVEAAVAAVAKAMKGFQPFDEIESTVGVEFRGNGKNVDVVLGFESDDVKYSFLKAEAIHSIYQDMESEARRRNHAIVKDLLWDRAVMYFVQNEMGKDLGRHLRGTKFTVKDVSKILTPVTGEIVLSVKAEDFGMKVESEKVQVMFGADLDEGESTAMMCNECGAKFKKKLTAKTFEVKCPKCGSFDTEPAGA